MKDLFQVSELKIAYKNKQTHNVAITFSESAERVFRKHWNDELELCESMYLLVLDRQNVVQGIKLISIGGLSSTVCDPKKVFQTALLSNSSSIILAHNHPSGALKPSTTDIKLTQKIKQGAELLDLTLLDHIILTPNSYYSFADEGMI